MWVNMLVYGQPGVGKTTFAAKAPNALILDFESGTMSVRNMDVAIATPRTLEDIQRTIKKAQKAGFETLVIDSTTEMARHFMNQVMGEMTRKDPRKSLFSPTLEAWGMVTEMMRFIIRISRDAQMHTIFVGLETLEKTERDDKVFARPALSPKVGEDITAYVDIVGRMAMVKKERVLFLESSSEYIAKDRSGVLPATLSGEDLSFQHVIDLIVGSGDFVIGSDGEEDEEGEEVEGSESGEEAEGEDA